jgi:hypothetical protein
MTPEIKLFAAIAVVTMAVILHLLLGCISRHVLFNWMPRRPGQWAAQLAVVFMGVLAFLLVAVSVAWLAIVGDVKP